MVKIVSFKYVSSSIACMTSSLSERFKVFYHSKWNPELSLEKIIGKERVDALKTNPKYENRVDSMSQVSYSIAVGSLLDALAGATPSELASTRTIAIGLNYVTGDYYGMWRDKLYAWTSTTPEASRLRKCSVEVAALCTFQVPLYAAFITLGQVTSDLFMHTGVDMEKTKAGMIGLGKLAIPIAISSGYWMNYARDFYGLPRPDEKAQEALKVSG